jgi:hypothetical protein
LLEKYDTINGRARLQSQRPMLTGVLPSPHNIYPRGRFRGSLLEPTCEDARSFGLVQQRCGDITRSKLQQPRQPIDREVGVDYVSCSVSLQRVEEGPGVTP